MTLEQFLERLEQTPRDWYLLRERIRRGERECQCPIFALHGPSGTYRQAGRNIGLTDEQTDRIVAAADYDREEFYGPYDHELRAKLLKACGLA